MIDTAYRRWEVNAKQLSAVKPEELRSLYRRLSRLGTVELTNANHVRIWTAQGWVFAPVTSSDARSVRNVVAQVKRNGGAQWRPPKNRAA